MTKRSMFLVGAVAIVGATLFAVDQHWRKVETPPMPAEALLPAAVVLSTADIDTPEEILRLAVSEWKKVEDYQCTATSLNRLGSNIERNVISIIYKKPGLFRHAIVEGTSRGVLITYNRDGVVHARPGGLLSLMTVQMDPRDQRLLDARGRPFFQTDWGTELTRMEEDTRHGASLARLSDQDLDGTVCWVLHMQLPGPYEETLDVWIDQATHLPRRLVTLRRGQTIRDASFTNIALNTKPADQVFSLK